MLMRTATLALPAIELKRTPSPAAALRLQLTTNGDTGDILPDRRAGLPSVAERRECVLLPVPLGSEA